MAADGRRSLDWRFLLDDPEPRRALIVGGDDAWRTSVRDALEAIGSSVSIAAGSVPSSSDWNLVIARGGPGRRPDGVGSAETPPSLVIEIDGAGPWPRPARPHTRLAAWPSLDRHTELIPVRNPDSRSLAARRRIRRNGLARAVRLGTLWLPRSLATGRLVVATPGGAGMALRGIGQEATRRDAAWTLVTPRFRASRHVVLLSEDVVHKVEREPGGGAVEHEATVLRAVAGRPGARTPSVIGLERFGRHRVLVESRLAGRDLTPQRARRHAAAYARAMESWLFGLVGPPTELAGARAARLIDEPVRAMRNLLDADGDLVGRADALVRERLAGSTLPVAIEHGDLGDPNIVVGDDGTLGVLDWELGRTDGLPMLDLVFLIAYLAAAEAGAVDADGYVRAWERTVLDPSGWGAELIREHAGRLGINGATRIALIVLCWVTQLARLGSRVEPAERHRIGRHRYAELLRSSIAELT